MQQEPGTEVSGSCFVVDILYNGNIISWKEKLELVEFLKQKVVQQ